jgi:hypothetical protein
MAAVDGMAHPAAMPLLLLVPLLVAAVFVLWALLLPLSLWQRYRHGRARRRVQAWVVRFNAWLLAASVPLFLAGAWLATHWMPHALREAGLGLAAGMLVGIAGLALARFEHDGGQCFHTPNRWLVLAMTTLVAVRLVFGLWAGWQHVAATSCSPFVGWLHAGGVIAVGGVLLGYYLAYTWGLRARVARAMR